MQPFTLGRSLIMLNNLFYSLGAFIADWNETHVKNPRWPPHARFHNGQTMSMGAILCLTSAYFCFRDTNPIGGLNATRDSVWTAAVIGSMYTITGISGFFYPGALGVDPEFG